jgi:sortase A
MRILQHILLVVGIVCLGLWAVLTIQAKMHQAGLEELFERQLYQPAPAPAQSTLVQPALKEGALVGRLEIPRVQLNVMVMEGIAWRTLRLGAGRIPGTALPWTVGNVGIAGHRDTFFRDLKELQKDDVIRLATTSGTLQYRVVWTSIVGPKDTRVLENTPENALTLVTCYPFYYVGPAPQRFVVRAVRTVEAR